MKLLLLLHSPAQTVESERFCIFDNLSSYLRGSYNLSGWHLLGVSVTGFHLSRTLESEDLTTATAAATTSTATITTAAAAAAAAAAMITTSDNDTERTIPELL